jgi:hypothetical protein
MECYSSVLSGQKILDVLVCSRFRGYTRVYLDIPYLEPRYQALWRNPERRDNALHAR